MIFYDLKLVNIDPKRTRQRLPNRVPKRLQMRTVRKRPRSSNQTNAHQTASHTHTLPKAVSMRRSTATNSSTNTNNRHGHRSATVSRPVRTLANHRLDRTESNSHRPQSDI